MVRASRCAPPPDRTTIEFAAAIHAADSAVVGIHAAAHQDQFLRERCHLRIKAQRQRDVRKRASGPHYYFPGILMHHANNEVGGGFVEWLGVWRTLDQRG